MIPYPQHCIEVGSLGTEPKYNIGFGCQWLNRSDKYIYAVLRIRDPVGFLPLYLGSESGMIIPEHISENLETIFCIKILKFFDADANPGSGKHFDPKSGIRDNIPDPQHCVCVYEYDKVSPACDFEEDKKTTLRGITKLKKILSGAVRLSP